MNWAQFWVHPFLGCQGGFRLAAWLCFVVLSGCIVFLFQQVVDGYIKEVCDVEKLYNRFGRFELDAALEEDFL